MKVRVQTFSLLICLSLILCHPHFFRTMFLTDLNNLISLLFNCFSNPIDLKYEYGLSILREPHRLHTLNAVNNPVIQKLYFAGNNTTFEHSIDILASDHDIVEDRQKGLSSRRAMAITTATVLERTLLRPRTWPFIRRSMPLVDINTSHRNRVSRGTPGPQILMPSTDSWPQRCLLGRASLRGPRPARRYRHVCGGDGGGPVGRQGVRRVLHLQADRRDGRGPGGADRPTHRGA